MVGMLGRYAGFRCSKEDDPVGRVPQSLAAATVLEAQLVAAGAWPAVALSWLSALRFSAELQDGDCC